MKKLAPFIAVLTAVALLVSCAGGGNGVRFSDLFDESAAAEGTGVQFTGLVRAVVILATHDATARQRQIAEENGRRAVAKLQSRIATGERESAPAPKKPHKKKPSATGSKSKPKTSTAGRTAVAKAEDEPEPAPAPRPKAPKKLPRIIAVVTEKDENTDKKAAKAIMLFDTHAQKIIGNKVYDIEKEPRAEAEVRFETYSTSYIGAAL